MTSQASHDEVGTEPRTEAGKRTAQLFRELAAMNGGVGPSIAGIIAIENEAAHAAYDETKATIGAVKTQASERIRKAEAAAPSAQPDVLRATLASAWKALREPTGHPKYREAERDNHRPGAWPQDECEECGRIRAERWAAMDAAVEALDRAALQTPKAEEEK